MDFHHLLLALTMLMNFAGEAMRHVTCGGTGVVCA